MPTKKAITMEMISFTLKDIFDLLSFDDIQRLISANARKIKAERRKMMAFVFRLMRNICENPNASNHQ